MISIFIDNIHSNYLLLMARKKNKLIVQIDTDTSSCSVVVMVYCYTQKFVNILNRNLGQKFRTEIYRYKYPHIFMQWRYEV